MKVIFNRELSLLRNINKYSLMYGKLTTFRTNQYLFDKYFYFENR